MESGLNGKEAANGAEMSPLDYLLSVMNDVDTKPRLRIKAARIAAPYLHAHAQPKLGEMRIVIEDSFGFEFDPAVLKANAEKTRQYYQLINKESPPGNKPDPGAELEKLLREVPSLEKLQARKTERDTTVRWPAGSSYGEKEAQADWERITLLIVRRCSPVPCNALTEAEEIEAEHLHMRRGEYYAHLGRLARSRICELKLRGTPTNQLSAAEESELAELLKDYPDPPEDPGSSNMIAP